MAIPLLLRGSSARDGEMVARSGEHPESQARAPAGRREVVCFECRSVSKASTRATSTQCSTCVAFIDLQDFEIRGRSTQRVRTRGNVIVHKKGALLGTAVHCGSLIIEGTVAGSIYAQETVEFRTDAKILGEIRCRRLVVDRRVKVFGLQPVHVAELEVQGQLHGRIFSSGLVHVGKHGRLEGTLHAPRMRIEPGGELQGILRVSGRGSRDAAADDPPAE